MRPGADQDQGDVKPLGRLEKCRGRLTDRPDAAGRRVGDREGLDRVDHAGGRPFGLERRQDALERGLGKHRHRQRRLPKTLGSPPNLRGRLLARDVEDAFAAGGEIRQSHARERALADPRCAAEEHEGARHQTAAQHPIELRDSGPEPLGALGLHVAERHRLRRARTGGATAATPRS